MRSAMMAGLLLAVAAAGGCAKGREEPTATASGKVLYQGKSVPPGSYLNLRDQTKGVATSIQVEEGGVYSLPATAELPAGTYAVAISPPDAGAGAEMTQEDYDKMMAGGRNQPAKKVSFAVPPKFRDVSTSNTTLVLEPGDNTVDVNFGG